MTVSPDTDSLFGTIIDILAASVLIDHRVKDRELIEFTHAAILHNNELRPRKILSRRMLLNMFEARKADLSTALKNDTDDSFKQRLLSQVTDKDLQRSLLSSIFTIATCDYELHYEESDFIKSALKIWKTHMPSPRDVEAVA